MLRLGCLLLALVLVGVPLAAAQSAQRIVTLAPHLAELVHAVGAGDRLVGVSAHSDYPESVAEVPQVSDAFRVDAERLVRVAPDLVLAWEGGNPAVMIEDVERLGFRVVALATGNLDDIAAHLRLLGELTGREAAAEEAAAAYEARLAALRARYAGRAPVRVFYQIAERPLYTIGGGHSLSDAITACGGVNVFAGLMVLAPTVSVEAVLGTEPEVIVGGVFPEPGADPGVLAPWRRWTRIPAVRDGHLYQLDATLMGRATPRQLDGVETLCERIDRARR